MIFLSRKNVLSVLFLFVFLSLVNVNDTHAAIAGLPGGMTFNNTDVKGVLKIGDTVQATSTSKINLYELPIEGPSIVSFGLTYKPSTVGVGVGVMGLDGTNLKMIQSFVRNSRECGTTADASCTVGNSGIYQNRKSESRFFFDTSKMKDVIKTKRSPNDRFTKSYFTIYNSTPDKSLQYTLKLSGILCVENATSFDGSKECIDGTWVNKSTDGSVRASAIKDFAPTITKGQSIVDTVDASRKSVFFKFAGEKNKLITFKVNLLDTTNCKTLPFIISSQTGGTLRGKGNTDCSFTYTTNLKEKAFLQFRNRGQDNVKFKVTFLDEASTATSTVSVLETQENLSATTSIFSTTDLELGMEHPNIIKLQKFLNSNGYTIESIGGQPGSLGNESNYFGEKTKQALIKFQKDKGISPALGFFGPATRRAIEI